VHFRFGLLGPMSVMDDGKAVIMTSGNQRIVLAALLASANQAVSTDYLIEALWASAPPRSARVTLQNYVKRLRQNLGGLRSALITGSCGYQICASDDDVDILRFRRLARSGLDALRREDWAGTSSLLTTALSFWRGHAFGDVPSELLAQHHAAGLEEMRLQVLEARLTADLHLGRAEDVIAELLPLLAAEPLRERLYCMLMLALCQTGQQAAALSVYLRARRTLAADLGIDPGPELQGIHHRILQADPEVHRQPRIPRPWSVPGTELSLAARSR